MIPNKIIMHHSLTKDGATVSWQAIRRYHMGAVPGSTYNFKEIGYHYGIELINEHYEIMVGRMLGEAGAHTKGQNLDSIGICLVGNFDVDVPNDAQIRTAARLVSSLCGLFGISYSHVFGHRDFASYKSCPGLNFNLKHFRSLLG